MSQNAINRKNLVAIAKQEIEEWKDLPPGLAMVILWAFIHRVTEGETIEETFLKERSKPAAIDYQI